MAKTTTPICQIGRVCNQSFMESPGYQISFLVSNCLREYFGGEIDRTAGSRISGIRRADTDHLYFLDDPEYLLTVDGFDPRTLQIIDHSGPYYLQKRIRQ